MQTGIEHPHRDSISHPFAPIPAASNVGKDANEDMCRKSTSPEKSPALQQTTFEFKEPTKEVEEGQDTPMSDDG